jgi:hypothetical protein
MAEMKYVDSSFVRHKQKFLSSHMMIWMKAWVLIMHDLAGKSNCHWWTHASTVLESWRNPLDLASNNSDYASRWWLDQEPNKVYAKNWRKVREKKWRVFGSRSRFQNSVMLMKKTVMIWFIYGLLMMLLITISQNAKD